MLIEEGPTQSVVIDLPEFTVLRITKMKSGFFIPPSRFFTSRPRHSPISFYNNEYEAQ